MCDFLGNAQYTAADGQGAVDANSTETDANSTADSTPSEVISFADANLERAVRQAVNKPYGPLTVADVDTLTRLEANFQNIQSLAGLEYCTGLQVLELQGNQIVDLGPLAGLTQLQKLGLWGNQIVDLGPLAGLTQLQTLGLWGNQIVDLGPLAGLTQLQWLQLGSNQIADVSKSVGWLAPAAMAGLGGQFPQRPRRPKTASNLDRKWHDHPTLLRLRLWGRDNLILLYHPIIAGRPTLEAAGRPRTDADAGRHHVHRCQPASCGAACV